MPSCTSLFWTTRARPQGCGCWLLSGFSWTFGYSPVSVRDSKTRLVFTVKVLIAWSRNVAQGILCSSRGSRVVLNQGMEQQWMQVIETR
ncbi:uncharacterized protein BDV14DRAFT_173473 [Aspergillus stella-maris]|uniref:uncharacterized protein n=1 Tax=Aspergillus stella-maris TaxID=1810926 RepID=UPI003CCCDFF0